MEEAKQQDLFCLQCNLQFGKKLVFDLHLSLVHGKKFDTKTEAKGDFSEPDLDEDTTSKDQGENNSYQCEICQRCFKVKGNLKTHVASVHEGKKPFKCEICDKSFPLKGEMKKHITSVHEGMKAFKCDICDKSFSMKGNLKTHFTSVHEGIKTLKCFF